MEGYLQVTGAPTYIYMYVLLYYMIIFTHSGKINVYIIIIVNISTKAIRQVPAVIMSHRAKAVRFTRHPSKDHTTLAVIMRTPKQKPYDSSSYHENMWAKTVRFQRLSWDTWAKAIQFQQLSWDIRAKAIWFQQLSWDTRAKVIQFQQLSWDTRAKVMIPVVIMRYLSKSHMVQQSSWDTRAKAIWFQQLWDTRSKEDHTVQQSSWDTWAKAIRFQQLWDIWAKAIWFSNHDTWAKAIRFQQLSWHTEQRPYDSSSYHETPKQRPYDSSSYHDTLSKGHTVPAVIMRHPSKGHMVPFQHQWLVNYNEPSTQLLHQRLPTIVYRVKKFKFCVKHQRMQHQHHP